MYASSDVKILFYDDVHRFPGKRFIFELLKKTSAEILE